MTACLTFEVTSRSGPVLEYPRLVLVVTDHIRPVLSQWPVQDPLLPACGPAPVRSILSLHFNRFLSTPFQSYPTLVPSFPNKSPSLTILSSNIRLCPALHSPISSGRQSRPVPSQTNPVSSFPTQSRPRHIPSPLSRPVPSHSVTTLPSHSPSPLTSPVTSHPMPSRPSPHPHHPVALTRPTPPRPVPSHSVSFRYVPFRSVPFPPAPSPHPSHPSPLPCPPPLSSCPTPPLSPSHSPLTSLDPDMLAGLWRAEVQQRPGARHEAGPGVLGVHPSLERVAQQGDLLLE